MKHEIYHSDVIFAYWLCYGIRLVPSAKCLLFHSVQYLPSHSAACSKL